mmetsp:Transcript_20063/g.51151  ORF Transcript_20063/g.51151 Transcript_20063/m.51151 type:complete len:131 (+) Transcript_20063:74-466(+)
MYSCVAVLLCRWVGIRIAVRALCKMESRQTTSIHTCMYARGKRDGKGGKAALPDAKRCEEKEKVDEKEEQTCMQIFLLLPIPPLSHLARISRTFAFYTCTSTFFPLLHFCPLMLITLSFTLFCCYPYYMS